MIKIKIKEIKKNLNTFEFVQIINLIKNENSDSILANISNSNIKKYLEVVTKSKNLHLYTCNNKNEIIGYALIANKTQHLINEFYKLSHKILLDLIVRSKFLTIINLFLSFFSFDLIFIKKKDKIKISNNLNLNLLAIHKNYQSLGIGKKFLKFIFNDLKKNVKEKFISCETNSKRAKSFYLKKMKFNLIGKKIRILNNMFILIKKI